MQAISSSHVYPKLFVLIVLLLCALSWTGSVDFIATGYLNDSIVDAGLAFGSARLMNAGVSVLQSTTLSIQFFGGTSISIGEVLDPLNDMVEDFSTVMKYAIGSLLVQKVMLEIVRTSFFNIVLTLSGGVVIGTVLYGAARYQLIAFKTFITFVALRYLVVLMALLSGMFGQIFLDEYIKKDLQALEMAQSNITELDPQPVIPENLRLELEADIQSRGAEKKILAQEIAELETLSQEKAQTLEKYTSEYEEYPLSQRYNLLSMSEEVKEAAAQKEMAETEYKIVVQQLAAAELRQSKLDAEISTLERQLSGESSGFFEDVGSAVSSASKKLIQLKNKFSYESLKGTIGNATDSMFNAIVSFVMRSILFPLLFLYLVTKLFRMIWNIDLVKRMQQTKGRTTSPEYNY
ncbi:hypothetical protein [Bowmanella dokdonensis]|uniref:Uncharacterized protein n=1 Tax=Bowmanella dokdonensis TaxID=751969 RepID=A0A939DQM0_9ALTE|nr:hypothetical protein [Bowmanella dokdonensis]MBN7827163.1 hypothetical protein [Bowmanella dokdonensis]